VCRQAADVCVVRAWPSAACPHSAGRCGCCRGRRTSRPAPPSAAP
jgi:hypothetical protein